MLGGETIKDVAKDMGISEDTAQRTLKWAGEANMLRQYEQRLYGELLPLAHEAVKLALMDGDAQVALKIMEATGLGPNRLKGTSKAAQNYEEGLYGELARQRAEWDGGELPAVSDVRYLGDATTDPAGDQMDDLPVGVAERGTDGDEAREASEGAIGVEDDLPAPPGE